MGLLLLEREKYNICKYNAYFKFFRHHHLHPSHRSIRSSYRISVVFVSFPCVCMYMYVLCSAHPFPITVKANQKKNLPVATAHCAMSSFQQPAHLSKLSMQFVVCVCVCCCVVELYRMF